MCSWLFYCNDGTHSTMIVIKKKILVNFNLDSWCYKFCHLEPIIMDFIAMKIKQNRIYNAMHLK